MKRNITKFLAALALLVFTMPSLVAWGQTRAEEVLSTCRFGSDYNLGNSSYTGTFTVTNGNYTWTVGNGNNNNNGWTNNNGYGQVKFGRKNVESVGYITTNASYSQAITKVELTIDALTAAKINSVKLYTSPNNSTWTEAGSFSKAVGVQTVSLSSPTANLYYKIEFDCASGSSNGLITVSKVEYFYDNPSGTLTCEAPTFNPAAGTYTEAQNVVITTATEGATIYYTTDGNDPTTSSSEYTEALTISETTTVKAMAAKDGYNNSAVASATYTFEAPSFNQDWEGTMHGWSFVSVAGDQVWNVASYSNNHYAKMSGYSGSNYANEDWCISPTFNLGDYTNPALTFTTARSSHDGNELEVYFSNDYDGTNISSATWTQLTCTLPEQPSSGYSAFVSSGDIDLSSYTGANCYIGFKYTSTTSAAATWELDDIVLASQTYTPVITLNPSSINLGESNAVGEEISKTFTVSQNHLTEGIALSANLGTLSLTSIAQGAEATEVTWTYTPTAAGSINATITATSAGAETQTLTITGAAVAPVTGDRYEKVTTNLQDWSGCYIITGTNSGNYYALTGVNSNNLGTTAAVTVVGSNIESNNTTDAYQVFVAQTTNGYSLYMDGVGYLGYNSDAASGNNVLHALESFEANTCEWIISMTDGLATITNVRNTGRTLQFNYNSGNSRFACYTSSQVKPTLFKYTGTVVLTPSISAEDVSIESNATIGSISYTITNGVEGGLLGASTEAEWLTIGPVGETIPFTCEANTGAQRSATVTLTYTYGDNQSVTKEVTVTQAAYVAPITSGTGTITFGNGNNGTISINNESVTGNDNLGNTWTITTVGTTSFTPNGNYSQVGSGNKPATSITFTMTLPATATISAFEAKFGGFSGTAGTITLMVGGATVGTGSLDGTNDVTVSTLPMVTGTVLTVTVTNIAKGVKCYYISYSLGTESYTLTINGYTEGSTGGYKLIASPVTVDPASVAGMTTGNFDLYEYDDTQDKEWLNWKGDQELSYDGHFNLVPGKGYLYAKQATTAGETFNFTLTGAPYNNQAIQLIQGWNLIGNPLGETAYLAEGRNFYRMNAAGSGLIVNTDTNGGGNAINAMEGVFVNATETGTITFTTTAPVKGASVALNVTRDRGNVIDNAVVRFGEGDQLPKFQLFENSTKLYIPQGNEDFAVVRSAAQGEMPVSFKASENGTYTLAVETENMEMDYLHLIDNMTGMDVDLLQTPNYTFEAKTNDYASRFRLVFSASDNGTSTAETFAFFNGTSWTVSNQGEATLQVVDVMGRLVSTEQINGNATINLNETAGIYMLRLVNGNDVKVQKIVVR